MVLVKSHICKHKTRSVQLVQDTTGSGEKYTNVYLYCSKLGRRIRKKECIGCKIKETEKDEKITTDTKRINC
jgi:hypothetical protein